MSDTIKYFKKNTQLSFTTDENKLHHKLIIGDNYPALLNLLIEYKGAVDVIYIDPPYGKDSMGEFAETNYENAITRDNLLSMLYRDNKRGFIDSEKKIQIVDDIYKVRTLTDTKDSEGNLATEVYAEAEFYDLTFSVRKEEHKFDAETAEVSMAYALEGTEWSVGTVNVRTKRTWTSTEKNALSILRTVADLHGGDLVFDCPNRLVHLLTVYGTDSGALFAYKKNMKSIKRVVDTRSLVTRLYAIGSDGLTFADINGGKGYVEDYGYYEMLPCANVLRIKGLFISRQY